MKTSSPDSRIGLLPIEEARKRAEQIGLPDGMAELSVFRVLLHHPDLARAVTGLLTMLLFSGNKLDPRLRELVIMRIGWVTGSNYEWTQHWRVARQMDIPEEHLLAVRAWREADCFGPADRAVLAATDETLEAGEISEDTWALCERTIADIPALLELPVAIGNWSLFSTMLRTLRIPLEDGVEAWPPDGQIGGGRLG